MEMTLRWYGSKVRHGNTVEQIRQIPGVTGVITTLYDTAPGEVWSRERIQRNEGRSRGCRTSCSGYRER